MIGMGRTLDRVANHGAGGVPGRKEAVHRVLLTKGATGERARVVLVLDNRRLLGEFPDRLRAARAAGIVGG